MVFIDTHCHLEICKDVDKVIENAKAKDVGVIVTSGGDVKANRLALEFGERFEEVEVCLGIYPVDALKMSDVELDEEIEFILGVDEKIVGIGEVGLDLKHGDDLERQILIFEKFIDLASRLGKVLVVHSRGAEKRAVEVLVEKGVKKVVMHCFCGGLDLVDRIVNNGWYLSIPANVVFDENFQEVVERIDISRLLCETDSPFLHPVKGSRNNEPANVIESYKKIAEIKGLDLGEVEVELEKNFKKVFG
ncbi:TatD family hydrolase [archaeon]|jgi:TatD DNase family protein|nr:TatD family hydrolase [archaeon]